MIPPENEEWHEVWFPGPFLLFCSYIKDITRWREDMNFLFSWQEQYLTT